MSTTPRRTKSEVRMGRQGRIVIPADIRTQLGFGEGDRLVARVEDGELRLSSFRANLDRARAIVRARVPEGISLVDELIAERRRDAALEAAE